MSLSALEKRYLAKRLEELKNSKIDDIREVTIERGTKKCGYCYDNENFQANIHDKNLIIAMKKANVFKMPTKAKYDKLFKGLLDGANRGITLLDFVDEQDLMMWRKKILEEWKEEVKTVKNKMDKVNKAYEKTLDEIMLGNSDKAKKLLEKFIQFLQNA